MARHDPENRLSWRLAAKPLRDAFRFSGRSTRTEVVAFFLLSIFANIFTVSVGHDLAPALRFLAAIWQIGWAWPWVPLLVRRLRDQDRTPAWLVVTAVEIIATTGQNFVPSSPTITGLSFRSFTGEWRNIAWSWPSSAIVSLVLATSVVQLWLFLAPGTAGPNRYGSDPRIDPMLSEAPNHS